MRSTKQIIVQAALAGGLSMVAAIRAEAQGTARSLDIDASIRSAGMGGACNAVFWGADPNDWANPALLGYHSGLRYSWGKTSPRTSAIR